MRRLASVLALSLALAGPAAAQEQLARFKFEDAEAAFAAKDYPTTLAKLDEAQRLLGFGNPTIQHLRVLARYELLMGPRYRFEDVLRLRADCAFYLSEYMNITAVADKTREVYRTCETASEFPKDAKSLQNEVNFAAYQGDEALNDIYRLEKSTSEWSEPLAYLKIRVLDQLVEDADYERLAHAVALQTEVATYLGQVANAKSPPAASVIAYVTSLRTRLAGLQEYLSARRLRADDPQAMVHLQKAADLGLPIAYRQIGVAHYNGLYGLPKDESTAGTWFLRGAQAGDPMSMAAVGFGYTRSKYGLKQDLPAALEWYDKAIALGKGDRVALYYKAFSHLDGWGLPKDRVKARELFAKSAVKGDLAAMDVLAQMQAQGDGGPVDQAQSVQWTRKAAELGRVSAMERLAKWYENGEMGLPRDPAQARQWRDKAAASKN